MKNPYPSETGCCARFNPERWDEKEVVWDNKLFVKDRVRCFFYMPLNFSKVIVRQLEKIDKADAYTPEPPVCLSDHTSKWNMDLYIEVAKPVNGAENTPLSGTYLTKVFEGPFKDTRIWCEQMKDWVARKGKAIKRTLMYYTTCPKCAKHYGKNYVVYFAQV
ncbi:MAG: hypothetical protein LLF76_06295 [Planctomycetaceae bacterium]|nr:hypothetical protein [Planctomycetaceae bacterium]